jgi:hypothetical protein
MFLGFTYLQFNDPDALLWISIYGAMVVVCVMAIFERYNKILMAVLAVGYVVYCVLLWPSITVWLAQEDKSVLFDDIMTMKYPYIEESREFLGLVICLLVLAFNAVLAKRKKVA